MSSQTPPPVPEAFDWEEFRRNAHQAVDFIVDTQIKLAKREFPVQSQVTPGYLAKALPAEAPAEPSSWDSIMKDMSELVLPGVTHWGHPDFYAFFPAMMSPPALLGDLMANSFNQPGFNWVCSPVATEMELLVMDWLAKAFELPKEVLWTSGHGGGVMQPTATEAMVVTMLAARNKILHGVVGEEERTSMSGKLVAYYSDQSHFCVEKSGRILGLPFMRKIPSKPDASSDDKGNLPIDVDLLRKQLEEDKAAGLIPFYISVNYGATGICAIDPLEEIAEVAKQHGIWYNVDGAYAGVVAMCPEHRPSLKGVEACDSLLINGSKWFSTLFNTNFMWFKEREYVVASLNQTGTYLTNEKTDQGAVVDLKDYHLGLGRPFRSLKVYCTLKQFGLDGMRSTLRRHMMVAQDLANFLEATDIFTVVRVKFGLVCFRLKDGDDAANLALLEKLNSKESNLFMVHTIAHGGVVIRISLANPRITTDDAKELCEKIVTAAKA